MNNFSKSRNFLVGNIVAAFFALILTFPARAITFNVTYDSSVTGLTNAAQVEAAFNTAAQTIQNLYTNSSSVNITVYWGNAWPYGSVGLGASETTAYGAFPYATLTNAMRTTRTTVGDSNSVASLPAADPAASAGAVWYIPRAEIKALGLASSISTTANDTTTDGEIGFASNLTYTFDPTNRAVTGKFDLIGVAEHEITEVMGRMTFGLGSTFVPYDLFRFTNNGTRSFNINSTNVYFSVDSGVTALKFFNTNGNGGDIQDWASSALPDSYDAFCSAGEKLFLSAADLTSVDILGYALSYQPPRLAAVKSGSSNFQLTFTNTPSTTYTVLATTNIALSVTNWTNLGTATDSIPGQFQFTDLHATNILRFYRLRLN
jgi:hypothetical protein